MSVLKQFMDLIEGEADDMARFQSAFGGNFGSQQPVQQPVQQSEPTASIEFPDFGTMFDSAASNDEAAKRAGFSGYTDPRYIEAVRTEYERQGGGGYTPFVLKQPNDHSGMHEDIELARIISLAGR